MSRALKRKVNKVFEKITRVIMIIVFIILAIIFVYAQNNVVFNSNYIYESDKIPKTFTGYKIVQISDLCNDTNFVYNSVDRQNPNLVVITGNISDTNGRYDDSLKLISKLASKYNTVYVTGEQDSSNKSEIQNSLNNCGAICIEDKSFNIEAPNISYNEFVDKYIENKYIKKAEQGDADAKKYLEYTEQSLKEDADKVIVISGLSLMDDSTDFIDKAYSIINLDRDTFQVLAINQGQYFPELSNVDVDVIMAGNTFGKDTRNIGYKRGLYNLNGTTLFLSGGIGDSPDGSKRILNFPNIITVTLSDGTINNDNPLEKLLGYFISDVSTRFENDGGFSEYRYNY